MLNTEIYHLANALQASTILIIRKDLTPMSQKLPNLTYEPTNFAVQLQNYLDVINKKINHLIYNQKESTYLPLASLRAVDLGRDDGVVIEPMYKKHNALYPQKVALTYQDLADLTDLIPIIRVVSPTFITDILMLSFNTYKIHAINRIIDDFNRGTLQLVNGKDYKVIQKLLANNKVTFEVTEESYDNLTCYCSAFYRDNFIRKMIYQKNHAHRDTTYLVRLSFAVPTTNDVFS